MRLWATNPSLCSIRTLSRNWDIAEKRQKNSKKVFTRSIAIVRVVLVIILGHNRCPSDPIHSGAGWVGDGLGIHAWNMNITNWKWIVTLVTPLNVSQAGSEGLITGIDLTLSGHLRILLDNVLSDLTWVTSKITDLGMLSQNISKVTPKCGPFSVKSLFPGPGPDHISRAKVNGKPWGKSNAWPCKETWHVL